MHYYVNWALCNLPTFILPVVYQPLSVLDQAGGLENAAYTQLVAHADH